MGLSSLIRQVTPQDLEKLPSRQRNMSKVEEYLNAYGLHLQGLSQRGVQHELGHKHLRTTQNQIKRGEEIAKTLGLDTERLRLKLAAAFEKLADISIQQVEEQVAEGRITQIVHGDGSKEVRRQKGLDPRMLGEAGRGLIRFAEFAGLMDRAPEVNQASTTLIQLSAPSDGASFEAKFGNTVDVTASTQGDNASLPPDGRGQLAKSAVGASLADVASADLAQNQAQNTNIPPVQEELF